MSTDMSKTNELIRKLKLYCKLRPKADFMNSVLSNFRGRGGVLTPREEAALEKAFSRTDFEWVGQYADNSSAVSATISNLLNLPNLATVERTVLTSMVRYADDVLSKSQVGTVNRYAKKFGLPPATDDGETEIDEAVDPVS